MNRELLKVKFNTKNIKLPKPVKVNPDKEPSGDPDLRVKFIRLGFFVFVLVALFFGGKIAIEYAVSFCQGTDHQSFKEIQQNFQEYQREERSHGR
jgi:hypothetical protein